MASQVEYCETCREQRKVSSVEEISQDKKLITLVCGHAFPRIVKVANIDNMEISDKASWLILKDPVEEIRKAAKEKDYFKTVTYACSVFEYCGLQILVWESKKKGNTLPQNVTEWGLSKVINVLFSSKILTDTSVKSKMHCIRSLRNSFVHEEYSLRLSSGMVQKVDAFIDDIINCTAFIKAKYDEYGK
jgi:hypothetical protein